MTIQELMQSWLESGTESQKAHARARIAIGFDAPAVPAPAPPPRFEPFPRELLDQIKACPDRVPASCGCSLPECKRGKGNPWHLVTLEDCRSCLRETA